MIKINILLLSIILFLGSTAQSYSPTTNEYFTFSSGEKEVFKTIFQKVSANQVNAALKDYLKNYKAKIEGIKGFDNEYLVNEVVLSDINQNATSMAISITELEGNATLYIHYLTNGERVTASTTPSEFGGYTKFTKSLSDKAAFIAYEDLLNTEKSILSNKEKELKGLEKDEEKQHNDIGQATKSIKDSKTVIMNLDGSLKNQQALVAAKTQQVGDKTSEIASVSVKTLESNINDIDKENKDLIKDVEKSREEIAKINGESAVIQTVLITQKKAIEAEKVLLAATADKKTLKEVQSLEKEEAKMIGEMEELKGVIAIEEGALLNFQKKMDANKVRIADIQKQIVSHSEDALKDQLKILEKDLKDLESEEKKVTKDIEKENDSVTKQEENIRQAEGEITNFKNAQAAKKVEIEKMKSVLKTLETAQGVYK
jgi:chromosome segregation ATPase